jgi:hypothetical protein
VEGRVNGIRIRLGGFRRGGSRYMGIGGGVRNTEEAPH